MALPNSVLLSPANMMPRPVSAQPMFAGVLSFGEKSNKKSQSDYDV